MTSPAQPWPGRLDDLARDPGFGAAKEAAEGGDPTRWWGKGGGGRGRWGAGRPQRRAEARLEQAGGKREKRKRLGNSALLSVTDGTGTDCSSSFPASSTLHYNPSSHTSHCICIAEPHAAHFFPPPSSAFLCIQQQVPAMADKKITAAEVGQHKDDSNGYWLIVENKVYDVTSASSPLAVPLCVLFPSRICIALMDECAAAVAVAAAQRNADGNGSRRVARDACDRLPRPRAAATTTTRAHCPEPRAFLESRAKIAKRNKPLT